MDNQGKQYSRRTILRNAALAGAAATVAMIPLCSSRPKPLVHNVVKRRDGRQPNLILLVADDQRADSLSCAGNPILQTPNIDALATGGIRFTQSFATTAICCSSRAGILTGLHTRNHGVVDFDGTLTPAVRDNSYPRLLRAAGYYTGFVGKWGMDGAVPPRDDFDVFDGYTGQGSYFEPGNPKHLTTRQTEQALAFLHGCDQSKPFFLQVSFKAPHVEDMGRFQAGIYAKYPYDKALASLYQGATIPAPRPRQGTPIPAFLDETLNRTREATDFFPHVYQETMQSLYRLIAGLDIGVGRIMAAVRELGVQENTVVIYTSDHGSFYGEHGFGGKWLMHEESIRTPMVLCDPRLPKNLQGTTRQEMVLNIDQAPTLLELAGVPVPPSMQGKSLLALTRPQLVDWRSEWFYGMNFPGLVVGPLAVSEGIRTQRWKYTRYLEAQPLCEQLFDLHTDPHEEHDLADAPKAHPTLVALRQRWRAWRQAINGWENGAPWHDPV